MEKPLKLQFFPFFALFSELGERQGFAKCEVCVDPDSAPGKKPRISQPLGTPNGVALKSHRWAGSGKHVTSKSLNARGGFLAMPSVGMRLTIDWMSFA